MAENKFIKMLKENWIGGLVGGVIGFMNIGAEQISNFTGYNLLIECGSSGVLTVCVTKYTYLSIIILILLGAFIQSKLKK